MGASSAVSPYDPIWSRTRATYLQAPDLAEHDLEECIGGPCAEGQDDERRAG